jgi:hypothetical protein
MPIHLILIYVLAPPPLDSLRDGSLPDNQCAIDGHSPTFPSLCKARNAPNYGLIPSLTPSRFRPYRPEKGMGGTRFPAFQAGLSHYGLAALNVWHWPNSLPLFQHSYNEQEMWVTTRLGNLLAHRLFDGPPIWKSAIQQVRKPALRGAGRVGPAPTTCRNGKTACNLVGQDENRREAHAGRGQNRMGNPR